MKKGKTETRRDKRARQDGGDKLLSRGTATLAAQEEREEANGEQAVGGPATDAGRRCGVVWGDALT